MASGEFSQDSLGELSDQTPVYAISVAAQLAGMHPQTLRQYDRLGLVIPGRSRGRGRRYSARDVATLREVQRLSQDEGVSLAGIKRILQLQAEVLMFQNQVNQLTAQLHRAELMARSMNRVFAAGPSGEVTSVLPGRRPARSTPGQNSALVVWRPLR